MRRSYSYANGHSYAGANRDANGNPYADCDAYPNGHPHANSDPYARANCDAYPYRGHIRNGLLERDCRA